MTKWANDKEGNAGNDVPQLEKKEKGKKQHAHNVDALNSNTIRDPFKNQTTRAL
jgi:hypothetical protein